MFTLPIIMPTRKCWILLLVLGLSACVSRQTLPPYQPPEEGQLSVIVNVEGLQCCEGVLRLAVFDDERYWLDESGMVRGRLGFIQSANQTLEIHGLPAGRYAVAVYQDTDSDNRLDRWLGFIPKEPYGFSNNVGKYGPVSFNKAAFDLSDDMTIDIQLIAR